MYSNQDAIKNDEQEIVNIMRYNPESGAVILEKYYRNYFRKTVDDILVYNAMYSEECLKNAYEKAIEPICLLEFKKQQCSLPVYVIAIVRNEVVHVLQKEYYVNLQFQSDIAKQYCIDRRSTEVATCDSVRLNKKLDNYNKRTLSFFINRYFQLKDKEQIKKEMKIGERTFNKLSQKIQKDFLYTETDLVDLATNIKKNISRWFIKDSTMKFMKDQ